MNFYALMSFLLSFTNNNFPSCVHLGWSPHQARWTQSDKTQSAIRYVVNGTALQLPLCCRGAFWDVCGSRDPGQQRLTRNICFSFGRRAWMSRADTRVSPVTGSVPFCYVPNDEELESAQKPKTPKLSHYWLKKQPHGELLARRMSSGPKQTIFSSNDILFQVKEHRNCSVYDFLEKFVNENTTTVV